MGKLRGGVYHTMAAGILPKPWEKRGSRPSSDSPCPVNSLSHVVLTRLILGEVYPLPPLLRGSFCLESSLLCALIHLYELLCMNCACSAPPRPLWVAHCTKTELLQCRHWRRKGDNTNTDLTLMLMTRTLIVHIVSHLKKLFFIIMVKYTCHEIYHNCFKCTVELYQVYSHCTIITSIYIHKMLFNFTNWNFILIRRQLPM